MRALNLTTALMFVSLLLAGCKEKSESRNINPALADEFLAATVSGRVTKMKQLFEQGAPIETHDDSLWGEVPLHKAALYGKTEAVKFLIGKGADVNIRTLKFKNTPLHYAAREGHADIVGILISAGADINATDEYGNTPGDGARIHNHAEIARRLREPI